jgi:sialic acid synthase SpsE
MMGTPPHDIHKHSVVKFRDRPIGTGEPCFVTFEAGPTHDGLESAKRLVSHAAAADADAVKFQIVDPDRLVADRKQLFSYDVLVDRETGRTETVEEPLYDILCRRALSREQWKEVKRHSDALGLAFFATVTFEDELDLLVSLSCHSVKIASADVNYLDFIRRCARTGMCVQLDTGNASIGEIELAVDAVRREGNQNIIIHHCPSGYPARLEGINLRVIETLKQIFRCPIGFSDHSPGWEMDVAAVALGADLVEKTITEDRTTRSVEHIMSLEPPQMGEFVRLMRSLQIALGSPRRVLSDVELERRTRSRRSAHLKQPGRAGQTVAELTVDFRRPGDGIDPNLWESLAAMRLKRDLPAGHRLRMADLA